MRTVNRPVTNVGTPSANNIKQYFENHYKFNGLCDDENFLTVDQDTFSDANNVYVDEEGLLKSRPAIVKYSGPNLANNSKIKKILTFGKVVVYLTSRRYGLETVNIIRFVQPNMTIYDLAYSGSENVKIIPIDYKLYIFDENSPLKYYDMRTGQVNLASVYTPITGVVTNNQHAEFEKPNILNTSYITRYVYSSQSAVNFKTLVGKSLSVQLNGEQKDIVVTQDTANVLFENKYKLSADNYADDWTSYGVLGKGNQNVPLVYAAKNGTILLGSIQRITDDVLHYDWTLLFSVDGKHFNTLPKITEILGAPTISDDGYFAIVLKKDSPYIISLVATEEGGTYKYPTWTRLYDHIPNAPTASNVNYDQAWASAIYAHNVTVGMHFITDTKFAIAFATAPIDRVRTISNITYVSFTSPTTSRYNNILLHSYNDLSGVFETTTLKKGDDYTCINEGALKVSTLVLSDGFQLTLVSARTEKPQEQHSSYTLPNQKQVSFAFVLSKSQLSGSTVIAKTYRKFLSPYYILRTGETSNSFNTANVFNVALGQVSITDSDTNKTTVNIIINKDGKDSVIKYEGIYTTINIDAFEESLVTDIKQMPYNDNYSIVSYSDYYSNNSYITNSYYYNGRITNQVSTVRPITNGDVITVVQDGYIANNNIADQITMDLFVQGERVNILPSHYAILSELYLSIGNNLYISDNRVVAGEKQLYFPSNSVEPFAFDITNLHVISTKEVGIFTTNDIWYVTYDTDINAYRYVKSKLQVTCQEGNEILTSFDGKYTVFACERGLVAMSYQDFIASEEQSLTYLSDNIAGLFDTYREQPVKLFKYKYWIVAYHNNGNDCYIFDTRNSSWWYWSMNTSLGNIAVVDNHVELIADEWACVLDSNPEYYKDYNSIINWYFTSQKLYLGAINYYKHISNITIGNVVEDSRVNYILQTCCYRDKMDINKHEGIQYFVDNIRTFVKRVSYPKVLEFQYELRCNTQSVIQAPLSISNICVKYKVGGQVR